MTSFCARRLAEYPSSVAIAAMAGEGAEAGIGAGTGVGSEAGEQSGVDADAARDEGKAAFGAAAAARVLASEVRALQGALLALNTCIDASQALSCNLV